MFPEHRRFHISLSASATENHRLPPSATKNQANEPGKLLKTKNAAPPAHRRLQSPEKGNYLAGGKQLQLTAARGADPRGAVQSLSRGIEQVMLAKTIWLLVVAGAGAWAQKAFDVASIRPNAANDNRIMIRIQPGGRFTATGISAKQLMTQALNVRDFQILNAPGWTTAERWDINAVAEGLPERVPPETLRPMLRALLEERFQLQVHTETRELPIYELVVSKSGSKLRKSEAKSDQQMMRMGRGQLAGQGVPLSSLAQQLAQALGRDVIDRTGLAGRYDFELNWTPDPGQGGGPFPGGPPSPDALPAAGTSGPSIFTAVQEQLGLRLESAKGPVQVYIVDSISRPSGN
jgi:uncharacterized protein (TIGR03435 family)